MMIMRLSPWIAFISWCVKNTNKATKHCAINDAIAYDL